MNYYQQPNPYGYTSSMDFVDAPVGFAAPVVNPVATQQQYIQQQQQSQQMIQQQPQKKIIEGPNTVTINTKDGNSFMPKFTIKSDTSTNNDILVPIDRDVKLPEEKKRKGRPRKESGTGEIIRGDESEKVNGTVETTPSASYNYLETTGMLKETLGQIDSLNTELMQEFNAVRMSRTMKNKYNTLNGLAENIGALVGNRIQVIKEINSTINKAMDMDYKRDKDMRAANAAIDDDKYIADLYKSFMSNPNAAPNPQYSTVDPSIFGSGIVRANVSSNDARSNNVVDVDYLNYLSNLSPEQNYMRYESNPNVKQVVVFDAASGNKFFQYMDLTTNQVIPNMPVYDDMFMENTTLDLKNKIAKNLDLNEQFPIVVINEGVTSQY
jgi:hypothetical protein